MTEAITEETIALATEMAACFASGNPGIRDFSRILKENRILFLFATKTDHFDFDIAEQVAELERKMFDQYQEHRITCMSVPACVKDINDFGEFTMEDCDE